MHKAALFENIGGGGMNEGPSGNSGDPTLEDAVPNLLSPKTREHMRKWHSLSESEREAEMKTSEQTGRYNSASDQEIEAHARAMETIKKKHIDLIAHDTAGMQEEELVMYHWKRSTTLNLDNRAGSVQRVLKLYHGLLLTGAQIKRIAKRHCDP